MDNLLKGFILFGLTAALLAGCNTEENENTQPDKDHSIPGNAMDNYNEEPADGQVGYVRFQKDQLDQESERNHKIKVNREQMADMISRMILRYEDFDDVATLVTDNEILVAYKGPEDKDKNQNADIVKKTAYSLVPSFYHVYVSDEPTAYGDIQSLSNSTVYDENYNEGISRIVDKMKKSPQGSTTSENVEES
ncbi:YhcN/YlaJ family sporulation lipoprotein [Halobacillus sp. A1]|uniref:YhcN/YlaJ family sporulation lipoprotein n=1 Tax=Halobacillus campisalis TaxID=435909 RepID=A0ABW2K7S0_9BACI|nr:MULTISPECIES: YhcN/YlaJ family sporulation lipoprotein [Halobacillus]MCP3032796.1 YhcN/YlaJ family sporulation lipoprotein [Halobacillus sp. A1]